MRSTVVGPKQLSTQQITYWESTIERLSKMPEWQKNIAESFQINDFSGSKQTTALWQKQIKQIHASMSQLVYCCTLVETYIVRASPML